MSLLTAPYRWLTTPSWSEKAEAKRHRRDEALKAGLALVPKDVTLEEDLPYLRAGAREITDRIANGHWTVLRVLEAYIRSSARSHEQTNCLTEVLYTQALDDARALDKHFKETGKLKGVLHGVPLSLKDQLQVKGFETTMGFTGRIGKFADEDAALVKIIRAAGGVPFVKTNLPQAGLSFECSNPLFGCTTNPRSDKHTAGGSSGGEAAVLAMDGSAAGIGSDVGGSLRIPASYSGVYALKPGFGRWPAKGSVGLVPGYEGIRSVFGPMGRCVDDLELVARSILGNPLHASLSESTLIPLEWREPVLPKRVKFGYYKTDGFATASPASQRAVQETVDALRKQGHEVVAIDLPDVSRAMEIFVALSSSEGYRTLFAHLENDPLEPSLFLLSVTPKIPPLVRNVIGWMIRTFTKHQTFARLFAAARPKSVSEYWQATKARTDFAEEFREATFKKYELDALIGPVSALPAVYHGATKNLSVLAAATILYNVVDSTVGALPVTVVDPIKDALTPDFLAACNGSLGAAEALMYKGPAAVYDADRMAGLPIGVQLVGRGPFEEERVLALMKVVDAALGPRDFAPGAWTGRSIQKEA